MPARVGQQHQREQAGDLGVRRGCSAAERAREPDRLGRELDAHELRPRAARVALVEDQVEHVQHGREAARRRSAASGSAKGVPDSWIVCFARLMRCAIVASGTRNALAISAVVRPPTARSVSAIAEAVGQAPDGSR